MCLKNSAIRDILWIFVGYLLFYKISAKYVEMSADCADLCIDIVSVRKKPVLVA